MNLICRSLKSVGRRLTLAVYVMCCLKEFAVIIKEQKEKASFHPEGRVPSLLLSDCQAPKSPPLTLNSEKMNGDSNTDEELGHPNQGNKAHPGKKKNRVRMKMRNRSKWEIWSAKRTFIWGPTTFTSLVRETPGSHSARV